MGKKGDKLTSDSNDSAALFLQKIDSIAAITSKKMFGGNGIFHEGKMFGIVNSKGECYLKVDDSNRGDFEKLDAHQHGKMPYYSIPDKIMDSNKKLVAWANKSIDLSK